MSSVNVNNEIETYYVVSKQNYEKYVLKKREGDVCMSKFPQRVVKRIAGVLKYLSTRGITWNILGTVEKSEELPTDINILEYTAYTITGKGRAPSELNSFVKVLVSLEVPLHWFCPKVQVLYKKLLKLAKVTKSKNGKKKKKEEQGAIE